eukprot:6172560-Pleurochrysis_carterae.AAC.4
MQTGWCGNDKEGEGQLNATACDWPTTSYLMPLALRPNETPPHKQEDKQLAAPSTAALGSEKDQCTPHDKPVPIVRLSPPCSALFARLPPAPRRTPCSNSHLGCGVVSKYLHSRVRSRGS